MTLYRSRIVELAARAGGDNQRTMIVPPEARPPAPSFEALFCAHYPALRAIVAGFQQIGIAVVAIDRERGHVAGSMCLAARVGGIQTGIVGRHSEVDLALPDDPSLALRHLAFVVEPVQSFSADGEARFRVLDLHTGNPPIDEEGRAVEALTAEGAAFLSCGRYVLLSFLTGDAAAWPESVDDGWACLPERVYVEERLADGTGSSAAASAAGRPRRARGSQGQGGPASTLVSRSAGPMATQRPLLRDGEEPAGVLSIETGLDRLVFATGGEALQRGLLIGRYSRCHGSHGSAITSGRVSRVHLLVLRVAGVVYGVDLGTTNGSYREVTGGLERIRQLPMDPETRIVLAGSATSVRWSPSGS
jgi:hypothetical protein